MVLASDYSITITAPLAKIWLLLNANICNSATKISNDHVRKFVFFQWFSHQNLWRGSSYFICSAYLENTFNWGYQGDTKQISLYLEKKTEHINPDNKSDR